jgi:hypothetical protein
MMKALVDVCNMYYSINKPLREHSSKPIVKKPQEHRSKL